MDKLEGPDSDKQVSLSGKTVILDLPYNQAAAACYVLNGLAPVLWLVTEPPANRTLRYHSIQALALFVAVAVVNVLLGTIGAVVGWMPLIGQVIGLVIALAQGVAAMAYLGVCIQLILRVYRGNPGRLPVISEHIDKYLDSAN